MTTNEELKMRRGEWRMNEMNQNTKTNNEHLFSDIPFHSVRLHSVPIWRMERIIYHREVDRGILSIMLFKKNKWSIFCCGFSSERFRCVNIQIANDSYNIIYLYYKLLRYKKNHDDSSPAVLRIVYLGVVKGGSFMLYTFGTVNSIIVRIIFICNL